jgi:hypothetical protein
MEGVGVKNGQTLATSFMDGPFVGLIDAKALTWLNLYSCEAVRHKPQNSLKNAFFACF